MEKNEKIKKQVKKEEEIIGLFSLFIVLAVAFGGGETLYAGLAIIGILFIKFLIDFSNRSRREHKLHKRAFNNLSAVTLVIIVILAFRLFF
ncbi:hypothetical protein GLW04_13840 [Halobacillus litoralis]|uniref:Uncharacterized protein n=1 Tax=Halobacillus litoralis TaxID=45668 RepID=A0A845DTM3_9BACI|nr:hypothetical protein [Halobacillus litoralis]MYL20981.1 hypothetical protein [Halobacillus litoralis]